MSEVTTDAVAGIGLRRRTDMDSGARSLSVMDDSGVDRRDDVSTCPSLPFCARSDIILLILLFVDCRTVIAAIFCIPTYDFAIPPRDTVVVAIRASATIGPPLRCC